jgi:hypothetical protein
VAVGSSRRQEDTPVALVASSQRARDTLLDDSADRGSPGLLRPTARASDRSGDDVGALVVSAVKSSNKHISASSAEAAKDTVRSKRDARSSSAEAFGVLALRGNDTSNVSAVAAARVVRVVIRVGVLAIVVIADKLDKV